jgi:hypothetical protein
MQGNDNHPIGFRFGSRIFSGLTVECPKIDVKHPRCAVCGRRFDRVKRSDSVRNLCVSCVDRMDV